MTRKTETRILLYFLVIAIVIPLILIFVNSAEGAGYDTNPNPPRTSTWGTARALRQAALQFRAHFGGINAANKRCGPAMKEYTTAGKLATRWKLAASNKALKRAKTAMRQCK